MQLLALRRTEDVREQAAKLGSEVEGHQVPVESLANLELATRCRRHTVRFNMS
ncbi:hypothetical protein LN996_04075 [Arthrobacter sp. AK01]|uniref:hypothetical protein n=1 Tax=Micrococcaceae TaxID=1268 RepID=UPI001E3555E8|nr:MULTISPECIES: hypothetical protein [Micrococcaceae]MCD4849981.1 hypothetical protein [Arthrobacter sp. AK01]MCP1412159.1 hypothetical protein [Paenarthrobacter sp. A20]